MEYSELKYKEVREALVSYIRSLADKNYQQKIWVNIEIPKNGYESNSNIVINGISDCIDWDFPEKSLGDILLNDEEIKLLKELLNLIDKVLDSLLYDVPDSKLIESEFWEKVVAKSKELYTLMTNGKSADGFFEELSGSPSEIIT